MTDLSIELMNTTEHFQNMEHGDRSCNISSPRTLSSCQFSSNHSDLRDHRLSDSSTDLNTMSYECRSINGMLYNSHDFGNGSDNINYNNKPYSQFYGYTSLPSHGINSADNIIFSGSSNIATHSAMSSNVPCDNLIHTTPVISLPGTEESKPSLCSTSLTVLTESLKKKEVGINKNWDTRKTQNLKSAKRNLKYLPDTSSRKWLANAQQDLSGCMYGSNYEANNLAQYHNLHQPYPNYINDAEFPTDNYFKYDSGLQYRSTIVSGDQVGCSDGNSYCDVSGNNAYLDGVYALPNLTTDASIDSFNNISQDLQVFNSSTQKDINIKKEKIYESNENNLRMECNFENEGLTVGPPIRFTDHLDPHLDASVDFRKLKRNESSQFVCCKCITQISDCKPQFHVKASESTNIQNNTTTKDNNTHCLLATDKNNSKIERRDVTNKDETSIALNKGKKRHKREDNNVKISTPEVSESSKERAEWLQLSIEAAEVEDHSSQLCFGCQKPVIDRYVIQVKDHGFWHAECLKCSNCHDNLSSQKSCYVKNEQVFCRNDYNILFGLACVKCSLQFKREQDWMRVAGQHRYHIACFLCKICKRQLGNNEKYHLVNGTDIYCTNHYRDMVNGDSSDGQQPPKKAKRNRTSYTEAQIKFLQDRFLRDSNPDGNELEKIATHISLKKRVVQVWFQNNRARLKKSANNTKGGNQENKSPSVNSGVTGNNDAMCIDWDNSLEQSSLDEHTYPNSASPSNMRPGSAHFMDPSYDPNPTLSGSSLCLQTGNSLAVTMGHESGSLGDGSVSGTSTCGTPRDQISPHFSDMSNPAYQCAENAGVATSGVNDNNTDDLPGAGSSDYNKSSGCSVKGGSSPNVILSALRSSVMRDKFSGSCQRRLQARDQQEQDMRHHMMLFQDQPLRHPPPPPPPHQQPYHIDLPFGHHMGIYGNIYNVYGGYGSLNSITSDQNVELSDSHQSFLRIKGEQPHNSLHVGTDQLFDPHYNSDSHIFNHSHLDMNAGFGSLRPPFGETNGHSNNSGTNGNSSPLSFLGSSVPNPLLQTRSSSDQCSFLQGHQMSSPLPCGQGHNYVRANCASPAPTGRQNGGSYMQPIGRNGDSYLVDGETV